MSIFMKNGVNELGIRYEQIEEITTYFVENKEQHEALCKKLNEQIRISANADLLAKFFTVTDVEYPTAITVDAHDMLIRTDILEAFSVAGSRRTYVVQYENEHDEVVEELCSLTDEQYALVLKDLQGELNCENIIILDNGEIIESGIIDDIYGYAPPRYFVYDNNENCVSDSFEYEEDAREWAVENGYNKVFKHTYFRDENDKLQGAGVFQV